MIIQNFSKSSRPNEEDEENDNSEDNKDNEGNAIDKTPWILEICGKWYTDYIFGNWEQ